MNPKNITKEYTNGEITVLWQSAKCIHSGNCVRNLPEVFQPKEVPWIKMEYAQSDRIIETVSKCPGGALSIKE
ncbi:MAG: (4Fe-4S)-binding protein [Chitinophagaceae bacterium]|nr:(4Fe-4S)-binding protein [Chitinophagaceae bacterium]